MLLKCLVRIAACVVCELSSTAAPMGKKLAYFSCRLGTPPAARGASAAVARPPLPLPAGAPPAPDRHIAAAAACHATDTSGAPPMPPVSPPMHHCGARTTAPPVGGSPALPASPAAPPPPESAGVARASAAVGIAARAHCAAGSRYQKPQPRHHRGPPAHRRRCSAQDTPRSATRPTEIRARSDEEAISRQYSRNATR